MQAFRKSDFDFCLFFLLLNIFAYKLATHYDEIALLQKLLHEDCVKTSVSMWDKLPVNALSIIITDLVCIINGHIIPSLARHQAHEGL